MVGIISTIVSLLIRCRLWCERGYLGGRIDNLMMRFVDILYSLPYIILVIVLLAMFRRTRLWPTGGFSSSRSGQCRG